MGYKLKRILIYPDGVTEKQVYPAIRVQTFDFQNDGALGWTNNNIGYGDCSIVSGEGWMVSSSGMDAQAGILPPSSVYGGILKSFKIYWYKSVTTTSTRGTSVGMANATESSMVEYGRNHGNGGWIGVFRSGQTTTWTSAQDLTGDIIQEMVFEDNGHITVNLIDSNNNKYSYDVGAVASDFQTLWSSSNLGLEMGKWYGPAVHYIRKVEITTT